MLAFVLSQAIDVPNVATDWENALPSCHWVGSNDWMHSFEFTTDILWCAARIFVQLETGTVSNFTECGLSESCCERFQKSLIRFADAIVDFIAGGPESICYWLVIIW